MQPDGTISIKIQNPFTGESVMRELPGMDDIKARVHFDAMKDFIRAKLKEAKLEPAVVADGFKMEKLLYLIIQLYQPNNEKELFVKLEKFREYLGDVPQFKQIYDYFYSSDAAEKIPSQIILCGGCKGTYAVSSHATAEDSILFHCPWCRSKAWSPAGAGATITKPIAEPPTEHDENSNQDRTGDQLRAGN